MTQNQLRYWENQYTKRHNARVRAETERSNRVREAEERRAHLAQESENRRANRTREAISAFSARQNDLHQVQDLMEKSQHNRAVESAQVMSNELERQKVDLGYYQANKSAQVGLAGVGATYANVAATREANLAKQAEINRSNLINEGFTAARVANEQAGTRIDALKASYQGQDTATRRQSLGLETQKWRAMLQPETNARIALMNAQALGEANKRQINTFDAFTRAVNTGISIGTLLVKKNMN